MLVEPNWPESWPFSPTDFQRYDESKDERFYDAPRRGLSPKPAAWQRCMVAYSANAGTSASCRFVTHIDDGAIAALTRCAAGLALAV